MAQQLCMSLKGNAQKLFSDLNEIKVSNYNEIMFVLEQRFHPLVKNRPSGRNLEIVGRTKMSPSRIMNISAQVRVFGFSWYSI